MVLLRCAGRELEHLLEPRVLLDGIVDRVSDGAVCCSS